MLLASSLLLIGLLIALNALYVAAEFATVSVRKTRIRQLADDEHPLAKRLLPIIDSPATLDNYIAACQIGITLSSLVLGAFGQASLAPYLTQALVELAGWSEVGALSAAIIILLVVLTSCQMVLGELVPKSVALRFATGTALYTVVPVSWSLKLFSPLIVLLNGSAWVLLGLFGVKHTASRHVHSPEEIAALLSESSAGGMLAPDELRWLHNALHLSTRTAGELMVPREQITALPIDAPPSRVLGIVAESPYTRLPVYRGTLDTILGVVHTKDVLIHQIEHGVIPPLRRLLRPAVTAPRSTPADRLLVMLREHRGQQALVTDEAGAIVGLVTLEDALTELFGELADEFKSRRRVKLRTERRTAVGPAVEPGKESRS